MEADYEVQITVAWWLKPYFYGLAIVSAVTGLEPDEAKVTRWIDRALSVKIILK
jgi:hypothetical protein